MLTGSWMGIAEPRPERRPPNWPLRPGTACHRAPRERRLAGSPRPGRAAAERGRGPGTRPNLLHMGQRARGPGPPRRFWKAAAPGPAGSAGPARRKPRPTSPVAGEAARRKRRLSLWIVRRESSLSPAVRTANVAPPSPGDADEDRRAATPHSPVMSGVARRRTSRRLARVRATPSPAGSGTRRIRAPG